jgi:hypothetical protein
MTGGGDDDIEDVYDAHEYIRRIECLFALLCGGFICFSYFRFEDLRSPGFTIVFYMTLCDALANIFLGMCCACLCVLAIICVCRCPLCHCCSCCCCSMFQYLRLFLTYTHQCSCALQNMMHIINILFL